MSLGAQVSGAHWQRAADRVGVAGVLEGLSGPHHDYLAAGGVDGRLAYGAEQILEVYYRLQLWDSVAGVPLRVQLSPDFQFIRRPGYNEDRGPVRFYGLRVHLEY